MKIVLSRLTTLLLFLVIAFASFFYTHRTAIDSSLRYRPLANGWVSMWAIIQMSDSLTLVEKIQKTIDEDLVHGRFRPAFFFYSTVSYALSPIFHGKLTTGEERKYNELMTGDLRLYSWMLLASLSISACLMCLLVHSYTDSKILSLLPLVFIPLSPSVTENLLQNYIDSQEIPLILWVSIWMFLFFKALHSDCGKRATINIFFGFSLVFLAVAFLAKETMVVIVLPLFIITLCALYLRFHLNSTKITYQDKWLIGTFLLSVVFAIGVTAIVSVNKHGYAQSYQVVNVDMLRYAIKKLWSCISLFSLHNGYGFFPIILSCIILFFKRGRIFNGKSASQHFFFLVFLIALSYGFLFVLTPWNPILVKYVLPSVFFFSFAVAYALGIILSWFMTFYSLGIYRYAAYGLILPYVFIYSEIYKNAETLRESLFAVANYGVEVLDKVADSIDGEIKLGKTKSYKVYVGFDVGNNPIQWRTLQLKRMLNFEKKYNLRDFDGTIIRNTAMPREELTSFNYSPDWKTLFLSDNHVDLEVEVFDIVYKGYLNGESIPHTLQFGRWCYQNAGEIAEYKSRFNHPAFRIAQFLPVNCAEMDNIEPRRGEN